MIPAKKPNNDLIEVLPKVRGTLEADASMAKYSWFKTGGVADVLFQPVDVEDLMEFLVNKPADVPLTFIGAASNIIIRDGGIEGVVIRAGAGFSNIEFDGDIVCVGSATHDLTLARKAQEISLGGLEFLSGIPGTIGGGLSMNAGAYGREFKDVFVDADALDNEGNFHRLEASDMGFQYRNCSVPKDWIFVAARLQGTFGNRDEIRLKMEKIHSKREATQPLRIATGGSTFRNPELGENSVRAWELIERAGCRNLARGGAQVSKLHCNFLINSGGASSSDLEWLGEEIRRRVFEDSGVSLIWEIRRIGRSEGAIK
ncbi:MAG: UDP-N-acetylmuramate dehydrogenase [Pseudomonadota bacterium]|nr:UDP-N-acetylmuramate dehydrogenase [Pseudomonadota bacterium]